MPELDTVAACAAEWESRRFKWLRPQSQYAWRQNWRLYIEPVVGDLPMASITTRLAVDLFRELERRGLASNTIRQARWVLSVLCASAVEQGILAWNPVREVRIHRHRARPRQTLSAAELDRLLTRAWYRRPDLAGCFDACGLAGLRMGEALALQRTDPDFTAMTLRVVRNVLPNGHVQPHTKSGDGATIVMADRLAERLTRVIAGLSSAVWLFPSRVTDGPVRYQTVMHALHAIARLEGLGSFGSHTLRRSYSSILASRGVSPDVIRRQLRHASLRQTEEYIDSAITLEPQALAALRQF